MLLINLKIAEIKGDIDTMKGWFSQAWIDIKGFFSDAWDKIVAIWGAVSGWFNDNVVTPVKNWFSQAWIDIAGFATTAWDAIKFIWAGVADWFDTNIWTPITTRVGEVWDGIKTAAGYIGTSIGNLIIGAINSAIGIINGILVDVQDAANQVIDWIDIFNSGKQYITIGSVPTIFTTGEPDPTVWGHGAAGAVIPPNAPFPVIYGDQRSGKNLESPESLLRQIVREESGRGAGAQGGTISFDVDEAGLMRYLHPKFEAETKRVGTSMAKASAA